MEEKMRATIEHHFGGLKTPLLGRTKMRMLLDILTRIFSQRGAMYVQFIQTWGFVLALVFVWKKISIDK